MTTGESKPMSLRTNKNDFLTRGGGGGKPLWLRRFLHLDWQDSSKNLDKIAFLRRICHGDPDKIASLRKTYHGNLSKIFSFGNACNCLKKSLFRFIKFLFGRRNFQLRKKSSGATFVESALVVALVVITAIGGLGYLGQSLFRDSYLFLVFYKLPSSIHLYC
jgi:Flp pilus assembly pilin Flp